MCTHQSPNTSECAANSVLCESQLICAQSMNDNFIDDITAGKNKNQTFFQLVDSEKLKNHPVDWWTQAKNISDAGLVTYA